MCDNHWFLEVGRPLRAAFPCSANRSPVNSQAQVKAAPLKSINRAGADRMDERDLKIGEGTKASLACSLFAPMLLSFPLAA